jgi:2-methylisocitrate lyase-like PEP mutase family enzyme
MTTQTERATTFANLHIKGDPLILFNVWDAGSARAAEEIGSKAIATGSWGVAVAHGYKDGETLPFDLVIGNLQRIVASVSLPVTVDLESGYGNSAAEVKSSVARAIEAGAIGVNFEDQIIGQSGLYAIDEQCARIAAAREAADEASVPLFINARTDIFIKAYPDHTEAHLQEAIARAKAYAEAGASGFFAPALYRPEWIEALCEQSPIPVNIMVMDNTPSNQEMAALGVARISYGAGPYRLAMNAFKEAGRVTLMK